MDKLAVLQEGYASETDRSKICSFDYEVIEEPTKPLIHQAARFLFFKKGFGTIVIDGVAYKILPNTLIAIIPWEISDITEVLATLQFNKVIYDYSFINGSLKTEFANDNEVGELYRLISSHPALYLNDSQAQHMSALFDDLKNELGLSSTLDEKEAPECLSNLYVSNKVVEIMIFFERYIKENCGKTVDKETKFNVSQGRSILTYIYAHSSDKLTLEKLSKVFYMSESSISKHIMDITGVSFINVLNDIRIEKAVEYLIHTDLSLNDIASLLGFVDASHISKHFQSNVGLTPMEYRKYYKNSKANLYSNTTKDFAYLITDYLYKNYATEKLSCNQVAQRFGVSPVEVNRSLLYYTEKNFDNLLNFIRINKACELLASTDDQILYIALDVGYSNVKTFNLNFIKYKNMTPSNFRKNVTLQFIDGSETGNATGKVKKES
ncbi:MAG: AraC family transcriptional regulator [Bacilli bacterium]